MPLYIKLDFGNNGLIYAWWKRHENDDYPSSSVYAVSVPTVLRKLANVIAKKDTE